MEERLSSTFSNLAATFESNKFSPMFNNPTKIFSDKVYKIKPISTQARFSNKEDFEFVQNEPLDLPKKENFVVYKDLQCNGTCSVSGNAYPHGGHKGKR